MKISESWAATRPVSSQILLPLIVIALAGGLINQDVLLLRADGVGAGCVRADAGGRWF
jgi:hypothetical protein